MYIYIHTHQKHGIKYLKSSDVILVLTRACCPNAHPDEELLGAMVYGFYTQGAPRTKHSKKAPQVLRIPVLGALNVQDHVTPWSMFSIHRPANKVQLNVHHTRNEGIICSPIITKNQQAVRPPQTPLTPPRRRRHLVPARRPPYKAHVAEQGLQGLGLKGFLCSRLLRLWLWLCIWCSGVSAAEGLELWSAHCVSAKSQTRTLKSLSVPTRHRQ